MLLRTLMRSSAATYVVPFLVVFVLVALGNDLTAWTTDHYWPSATANSTYAQPFIFTTCAALGAWEGARLTRGRVFKQASARSALGITAPILAPVVAGGVIAALVALFLSVGSADLGLGMPDVRVLGVELLLLIANTLVGHCIGRRWPAVISVPVVLVGAFICNAYPVAWSVLWVRHLVGAGLRNCCAVDQIMDPRALWSAAAFAVSLALACAVLINYRTSRQAVIVALALVMAGAGTAASAAYGLNADPVIARPTAGLICRGQGGVDVCLWPEVRDADMIRSETGKVIKALATAGVPTPAGFTMAASPAPGEAKLGVLPNAQAQDIPVGVVSGMMPSPPACASTGPYPAGAARAPVAAWLLLTAGSSAETVTQQTGPMAAAVAQKVRQLPQATQLTWYQVNTRAMTTCTTKPQLVPVGGTP
ncbi:hypothetical protein OG741_23030 [Streptomyces sp. NBC_01410]|uniref:DUF7224 domain-containing protein n=1 Tax=Streptomyces sp. NBC_01410 TaxID=2903856 RepID=UPI0032459605